MWHIAIPAICLLAHLYLVVLFLPAIWREIDERGFRWHHATSLFVLPAGVIALVAAYLLANLGTLRGWLLLAAFLAIDALIVGMVLAAVRLSSRRPERPPRAPAPPASRGRRRSQLCGSTGSRRWVKARLPGP